jgi:hypothetical protein
MDIDPSDSSNCVSAADVSALSAHLGHSKPAGTKPLAAWTRVAFTDEVVGVDRLRVGVELENVDDMNVLGLVLRPNPGRLSYISWRQSSALSARTFLTALQDESGPKLVLLVLQAGSVSEARLQLGTLDFIRNDGATSTMDLRVEFAEGASTTGEPWAIARAGKPGEPTPPAYLDRLEQNEPNPFNPTTVIRYSISRDAHVQLAIYNVQGLRVRTLVNEQQKREAYRVVWDGRDQVGNSVGNGIYITRLTAGDFEATRKLVVVR